MPLTEWHLPNDVDVQVDDAERVGQRSLTEDMAVGPDHDLVENVTRRLPSFDDRVRGGLAFIIVIVFLVLASTSLVIPALAKPVAFSLGAVGELDGATRHPVLLLPGHPPCPLCWAPSGKAPVDVPPAATRRPAASPATECGCRDRTTGHLPT